MASARDQYPAPTYPFGDELCAFMDAHRAFAQSLKLANPARFDFLNTILCSRTPDGHPRADDQVLGLWYLDKKDHAAGKRPFFKQDFIVNVGGRNVQFVSYVDRSTLDASGGSPHVGLIDNFFRDYDSYLRADPRFRPWLHHFDDVEHLPGELQENGRRAKLSNPLLEKI